MIKLMITMSHVISGALIASWAYLVLSINAQVAALVAVILGIILYRQILQQAAEKHMAQYGWPQSERCYCSDTCIFGVHQKSLDHKQALARVRQ